MTQITPIGRAPRVAPEQVLDIGQDEFLMLLIVL